MACPSIAALERYKGTAPDNPERAEKEALAAACRQVDPSEQGLIGKVAGANVCVLFTAKGGGCLWISATTLSGRMSPDQNQDNSPLSGFFGGLQNLLGGSRSALTTPESPVFLCQDNRKPRSGSPFCVSPRRRLTALASLKADQQRQASSLWAAYKGRDQQATHWIRKAA